MIMLLLPLLSSSNHLMESNTSEGSCLDCGCQFDPYGRHAYLCRGKLGNRVHSFLKLRVKKCLEAGRSAGGQWDLQRPNQAARDGVRQLLPP